MRLTIKILLFILLAVFLITTVYTFFFLFPQELATANNSGDKLGYALTLPFVLIIYALAVFCEVELFFGLKHLLSSISNKKTASIILSALMIFSVLTEITLGILLATGNYNLDYFVWIELALLIFPICAIALHIFLFSISIVSKIRNSSQKTV